MLHATVHSVHPPCSIISLVLPSFNQKPTRLGSFLGVTVQNLLLINLLRQTQTVLYRLYVKFDSIVLFLCLDVLEIEHYYFYFNIV